MPISCFAEVSFASPHLARMSYSGAQRRMSADGRASLEAGFSKCLVYFGSSLLKKPIVKAV